MKTRFELVACFENDESMWWQHGPVTLKATNDADAWKEAWANVSEISLNGNRVIDINIVCIESEIEMRPVEVTRKTTPVYNPAVKKWTVKDGISTCYHTGRQLTDGEHMKISGSSSAGGPAVVTYDGKMFMTVCLHTFRRDHPGRSYKCIYCGLPHPWANNVDDNKKDRS